ncbi:MAG: glycosyltransferase family 2 protein [Candidatus Paracaedibacteraceae bacterium]|nr:glycosyltransferase family 2 protein [Candidatus Paracaedibacteraceae bacterium]
MALISGVSVVIPFYNEQGNITPLIEEVVYALKTIEHWQVILVNDGSTDQTAQEIENSCRLYPNCSPVHHVKNEGQSSALYTGIQQADFDWIITLDGDGQNNPGDIPDLITALGNHNHHVVFGNRIKRKDSLIKKISSRLANYIRILVLDDRCLDTGCSLKLFPKSIFLSLPRFNHLHRFLPALFQFAGYTIINVPVSHRPRIRGRSKYGFWGRLWVGIFDLIGVYWLKSRYLKPALIQEPQPVSNDQLSARKQQLR